MVAATQIEHDQLVALWQMAKDGPLGEVNAKTINDTHPTLTI
jgi:hypothetical protein